MGTILSDSSHSLLVRPRAYLSARLRLFKPAAPSGFSNHFLQPLAFLYCLLQHYVPAVHSTIPKKCLPERSSFLATFFHHFFRSGDRWKTNMIRGSFHFQCDFRKPKSLFVSCFFESTLTWTFSRSFVCWWTYPFLFRFELQLFLNADPKIRMIGFGVQLSTFFLFHSIKATFYRSSDDIKLIH